MTQDEFVTHAIEFLEEIGADTADLDPDQNLFDTGVLDSLGTLAFLDFLEQQIGSEIEIDTLDVDEISTLRSTYRFVHARQEARGVASPA